MPANREGYAQLEAWAASLGRVSVFGVEGTGSYGVGLASFLCRTGHRVVEVNRGDRRSRRSNGKSDTLDAEAAARSVLSGQAVAVPKTADGTAEMIRQIKIARDTARKARTSAIVTLKAMIVTAPAEFREQLHGLSDKVLIDRCAALRPGAMTSSTASSEHALRVLAKRYQALDAEIRGHDTILDDLTRSCSPTLREGLGIGADTAAEMLIVFGDNPDRIRSEAAFAKLCGVSPVPAASGLTNRHRLPDTARPTPRSTEPSSSACASTNRPSTTSPVAPRKASPRRTSSAASSGSSSERSTSAHDRPPRPT